MLCFFQFNRYKGDNYEKMRHYFADVLIDEIEQYMDLNHKVILDVGGANGEFCEILSSKRQCTALNLDPFPPEITWPKSLIGFANQMPIQSSQIDLCINRGVIEHIPHALQQLALNEIHRVLKPGGLCYLMTQPWYNPHAGHHLKPFHPLPFKWAKWLVEHTFGAAMEIRGNSYADNWLHGNTFRTMNKKCLKAGFIIDATLDTHFKLHFLTRIPLIREFLVPSVVWILRKA
jgi:SAM-dependent methyltransferase